MTVPATPRTSRTETREAKVERPNRFDAAADRFDGDAPPPNARAASPGAPPGFPGSTQATAARARPPVPAAALVPPFPQSIENPYTRASVSPTASRLVATTGTAPSARAVTSGSLRPPAVATTTTVSPAVIRPSAR